MLKITTIYTLILTFIIGCFATVGTAYQEIEVKNGGSIKGKATLTGQVPEKRFFHLVLFPNQDMCAEVDTDENMNRVLDDFVVDDKRGLKDVVISIKHVEAGKPFENKPINILSENCKFTPNVTVIQQGGKFSVDNQDAVMHNSQVYQSERGKILLNIPIPAEEVSEGVVKFQKKYKIFQMICGMHEFMQTWGYRVQNPYNFVTHENGEFNIDQLPPGDYIVEAWHFLMKPQKQKITIEANKTVELNFEFDGNKLIRPLYETIKSGRIKKNARVPGSLH
jgi:hypothetical protein